MLSSVSGDDCLHEQMCKITLDYVYPDQTRKLVSANAHRVFGGPDKND